MKEMIHAEIFAERVIQLGGELTTQPDPISIGKTTTEMLEIDLADQHGASLSARSGTGCT